MRVPPVLLALLAVPPALALSPASAQDADAGRKTFETRCARCHGGDGNGGEMGPAITTRLPVRDDTSLIDLIHAGLPDRGMPPSGTPDGEIGALVRFLRSIERRPESRPVVRATVRTTDGRTLEGRVLAEGFHDLQMLGDGGRVHLLRRTAGDAFREVTSQADWPTYNGDPRGNRFTTLTQITKANVARLSPRWVFTIPGTANSQVTPSVVGGIMYVANPNECFALDAGTGREIWRYQRPRAGQMLGHANRGVSIAGDRLFMVTLDAHVIALNRMTGELIWDATLDDWRKNYSATSAPLVAGDLVISGVTGGEHGANGFVAAHEQATGREAWRFWTIPKPGEPGSETWQGKDIDHGGAPTWFTGSYDPELDTVYWPTGNPAKEYSGADRIGDNLYSDSILALDRRTGRLKWHYQFTPHDLWDWDATQTSVLIDAPWEGRPRRLLLHAARNGFFYVFDRTDGTLLLAKQFVRTLTWASGIGADGRPIKLPDQEPSPAGTKVCPSQDGATNWYSPSFNPATGLYYVQTNEKCSIYTRREQGEWESGKSYLGGSQRAAPEPRPERILRAIDIRTGEIRWEIAQRGRADSWGGTLATATGLVIFGEDSGTLMAADAETGKTLWSFPTNHTWKASPMTYMFDGRQYVAVAVGANIMAFGVPD
jgi:alcohol dehydrogenase (cytochrome c)